MDWITVTGLVAGMCTTSAFLPQVVKIFRTRKTDDISLGMYIILTIGILLWILYGWLNGDIPLMLANGITFILASSILVMKLRHG
jgi:MtN3 and saliva related transmembrane protein